MASSVATRFLILSDTHGQQLAHDISNSAKIDVVIHCGDLTEESKLEEFKQTISLLHSIDAPLKLVIAGNHDFTLDDSAYSKKLEELRRISGADHTDLVRQVYGDFGEARSLFDDAEAAGITLLAESMHHFELANGGVLKVYASPYTPSTAEWGFEYDPRDGHEWVIDDDADVVITHGPPRGLMDRTGGKSIGCPDLFKAVSRVRPKVHCFGHVHSAWGAKQVVWRDEVAGEASHWTCIDNERSTILENSSTIAHDAQGKSQQYFGQGYCDIRCTAEADVPTTICVNAAIKGELHGSQHLPWVLQLALPTAANHIHEPAVIDGMPGGTKRKMSS